MKSFFGADAHFAQVAELVGVVGLENVVDAGPHQHVVVVVPVAVVAAVVVAVAVVGGTAVASVVAVQYPFVVVVDSTAAVVAAVLESYDEILVDQPAVPPEDVVSEAAVEAAAAVDRSAAEMTELDAGNAGKTGLAASKLKRRPLIHMKTEELFVFAVASLETPM